MRACAGRCPQRMAFGEGIHPWYSIEYGDHSHLHWSRGALMGTAARELSYGSEQAERIAALCDRCHARIAPGTRDAISADSTYSASRQAVSRVNHGLHEGVRTEHWCAAADLADRALDRTGRPAPAPQRAPRALPAEVSFERNIRVYQQIAVASGPVREFLLGPFLVTAPLRRHLDHNPQSRFLRSRWQALCTLHRSRHV
jgi:hypothetical protein